MMIFTKTRIAAATGLFALLAAIPTAAHAVATAPATSGSATADDSARNGTSIVGGGLWSYGVTNSEVYSVYKNDRFRHSSTAKDGWGRTTKVTEKAGTISNAHRGRAPGGNQSFWNIY
ncbi:MAG: hypothetical protein JWP75_2912 [Frondihabitans sp.]|nr:hypothetical protein [Frondihabitans sp.]